MRQRASHSCTTQGSEVGLAKRGRSAGKICRRRPAIQRCCRKFGKRHPKGMSERSGRQSRRPVVSKCQRPMTSSHGFCRVPTACTVWDGGKGKECETTRSAFLPLAQMGERVWWVPSHPSNRRLRPLDSRFAQGRHWDQWMDRLQSLSALHVGLRKAEHIKRMPPSERWGDSRLDGARGSEFCTECPDSARRGTKSS